MQKKTTYIFTHKNSENMDIFSCSEALHIKFMFRTTQNILFILQCPTSHNFIQLMGKRHPVYYNIDLTRTSKRTPFKPVLTKSCLQSPLYIQGSYTVSMCMTTKFIYWYIYPFIQSLKVHCGIKWVIPQTYYMLFFLCSLIPPRYN